MMNEKTWVWFDMDGTIADLYGVDGWLADLKARNTRPYEKATPIYDLIELIDVIIELKLKGYHIGIISWLSKDNNMEYGTRVAKAKKEWLEKYLLNDLLDKILITPYGVNKADTCRPYGRGILVDDEAPNREKWDLGSTVNANENILDILRKLLDN